MCIANVRNRKYIAEMVRRSGRTRNRGSRRRWRRKVGKTLELSWLTTTRCARSRGSLKFTRFFQLQPLFGVLVASSIRSRSVYDSILYTFHCSCFFCVYTNEVTFSTANVNFSLRLTALKARKINVLIDCYRYTEEKKITGRTHSIHANSALP